MNSGGSASWDCAEMQLLLRSIAAMPEYVFVKDMDLRYVAVSDRFAEVMGYQSASELQGHSDLEIMKNRQEALAFEEMDREIIRTRKDILNEIEERYDKDSSITYRSTSKHLICNSRGEPMGILGEVVDVTKEIIAERRYEKEVNGLFAMSNADCYSAVIDLNEWKLVRQQTNPMYEEEFPHTEDLDEIVRHTLARASADTDEACTFYSSFSFEFFSRLYRSGKDYFSFKYYHRLPHGVGLWIKDSIWVRINPQNSHLMILMSLQSIEDSKQRELELHRAAERDGLTGLLNRKCGQNMIEKVLREENLEDVESYSMFMVDIDSFKSVNDRYGHQVGDRALVMVAQVLRGCFRENDIICRLGGDEFFAFVRHGQSMIVAERAQRILDRIGERTVENTDLRISVSVGVSNFPQDGRTMEELYRSADMALYRAKKNGKNQYAIYSE